MYCPIHPNGLQHTGHALLCIKLVTTQYVRNSATRDEKKAFFLLFWFQAELEAQLQETRREAAALIAEGKRMQVTYNPNDQGGLLTVMGEEVGSQVHGVPWARTGAVFAWRAKEYRQFCG